MPRYIDADALMQSFCKQCGVKDREYFCHAHCGDRMNIENIPTADVQPVVRCKDCKYRQDDDFCGGRGWPAQLVPDDGYCDRGARMDGERICQD